MAYSEYLADRVRPRLKGKGFVEEIGIMLDKKTEEDKLIVRVGKLNYEELLNKPGSSPMDFTGKPSRGFLFVGPDGFDNENDLDFWVAKALEFNTLLNT